MTDTEDPRYPVRAPGWAAIDRALGAIHLGQVPHQFASQTGYDLESPNPLPAIGVYEAAGPPHWHYVTYGLSELFEKSSPDPDVSGFGFELTFAVARAQDEQRPPAWPLQLLQGVGHYVLSGHGALDSGHVIDLGGPLCPDPMPDGRPTALQGVVCVPDPRLGKIETPHGSVLFLQLFGLTRDELEVMSDWDLGRKVGVVLELEPRAITRPQRGPWREDPQQGPVFRRYELQILMGD